ncbi:MAG: hypothetical protein M3Y13_05000 [Armatimonadota bacterium]|nr:hypothetical protein [Armatimonadota bacterium]
MSSSSRTVQELADLLLARDPLPPLVPSKVYDLALTTEIEASDAPAIVKAGLHLLNDDLATSHALSQSHEGEPLADYWHAIIHRREGDYGNSRYWFGRVGSVPILDEIYGPDPNAPAAFVERCRAAGKGQDTDLQQFQRDEMAHLLAYAVSLPK